MSIEEMSAEIKRLQVELEAKKKEAEKQHAIEKSVTVGELITALQAFPVDAKIVKASEGHLYSIDRVSEFGFYWDKETNLCYYTENHDEYKWHTIPDDAKYLGE